VATSELVLIDSNVLIDVLTQDADHSAWSSARLAEVLDERHAAINPIIFAEVATGFASPEELEAALPATAYRRLELPWAAAWHAAHAFVEYRRRGGTRRSPLPDFYIGAHALVDGLAVLTRDPSCYRSYFPGVGLIAPNDAHA